MDYPTLSEANAARQIEWLNGVHLPLTFRTNEMAGELGEVAELLLGRWAAYSHLREAWMDSLGEELADVIICAEISAWQLGASIDYAAAEGLATRVGSDYQWCAQALRDMGLLCNLAKKVDRTMYGIKGGVEMDGDAFEVIRHALNTMVRHIYDLAYTEHMNTEVMVARKFNKTSTKVGLQTMLVPPGIDRALLFP